MAKGKHFGSSSGKPNKIIKRRNYREIKWNQCQCSGSSQIPSQDDLNYQQFLSLYKIKQNGYWTALIIYNTEMEKENKKILGTELKLDQCASITQLPNGELFCYGSFQSGITLIIDRNYKVRILPFGIPCLYSSALYFDKNIYCFGGRDNKGNTLDLSRKFDLKKNKWINLPKLPKADSHCNSVIFNGNILISGCFSKFIWLYSIEIDSFSMIPYKFAKIARKLIINIKMLYLIEWDFNGLIYESEDEYHWRPISKVEQLVEDFQMYCLYNKEQIYISAGRYYQFDLKKKVLLVVK